jgi:hypothetical protein
MIKKYRFNYTISFDGIASSNLNMEYYSLGKKKARILRLIDEFCLRIVMSIDPLLNHSKGK